jgi:hypothetical protein
MKGRFPPGLGSLMHTLTDVNLQSQMMTGTLPASIGSLHKLKYLDLENIGLTGSLPASFTSLSNLERIDFNFASLSGTLPQAVGSLSQLETVNLNAQFTGIIPSSIGSLSNLRNIDFAWTELTRIPESFCGDSGPLAVSKIVSCVMPDTPTFMENLRDLSQSCILRLLNYSCIIEDPFMSYSTKADEAIELADSTDNDNGILVGVLVPTFLITAGIAAVAFIVQRRLCVKSRRIAKPTQNSNHHSKLQSLVKTLLTGDDIWIPSAMIEISNSNTNTHQKNSVLGMGDSGKVVLGEMKFIAHGVGDEKMEDTTVLVALKQRFNTNTKSTTNPRSAVKNEVSILQTLRHPNVVSFIGLYSTKDRANSISAQDVYIVMEYAPNGTINDHYRRPFTHISLKLRSRWMMQIAQAMEYLHQNNIVHLHLEPKNILLNKDMICLLTGFGNCCSKNTGFSTVVDTNLISNRLTMAFTPPEILACIRSPLTNDSTLNFTNVNIDNNNTSVSLEDTLLVGEPDCRDTMNNQAVVYGGTSGSQERLMKWDVYSYAMCLFVLLKQKSPFEYCKETIPNLRRNILNGFRPRVPENAGVTLQMLVCE